MDKRITLISLVLANFYPMYGVMFLGWDLPGILFLYWFENVVVGFYNVLKMSRAKKPNERGITTTSLGKTTVNKSRGSMVAFFLFHYGMFTFVHGIFLFAVLIRNLEPNTSLFLSIVLLFASHGVSYLTNYIGRKEYETQSPEDLMLAPYKRIVVMHLTVVFGAGFIMSLNGRSIGPLIILTVVKTFIDILSHFYEHNKLIPTGDAATTGKTYALQPTFFRKFLPFFEKGAAAAYRQSVASGKWDELKTRIDPKTAEYTENYWLRYYGTGKTSQEVKPAESESV